MVVCERFIAPEPVAVMRLGKKAWDDRSDEAASSPAGLTTDKDSSDVVLLYGFGCFVFRSEPKLIPPPTCNGADGEVRQSALGRK